ncbi:MAG: serine/threonine-protein kinase [Myxococcales bacterium]|nr:serine/threonine-protein kinase [Myxococcales bacterium]
MSAAAQQWQSGQRINSFLLLRELARGGMGEIWLALDHTGLQVERLVVIKRLLRATDDDPQNVTLFFDEARIASQLHHPNVVQVFTMGDVDGSPYLVMEYLPGQSLGRVVKAFARHHARIPQEAAARIIADAARGLGYAHRRKGLDGRPLRIVHRDVSPQNVLVTYDGHVKVLDFGIAVAEGRMTKTATGLVRGKLAYMSPEQAQGEPLAASSDVFSLGVMLWELLSGRRLYGDADELAVLRHLAMDAGEFPDPHGLDPTIDAGLSAIVVRALRRRPLARYADGTELSEALDVWLHSQPSVSLERAMVAVFGEEIAALPELQRAVAPTPSVSAPRAPTGTTATHETRLPGASAGPPAPAASSSATRSRFVVLTVGAAVAIILVVRLLSPGGTVQPAAGVVPLLVVTPVVEAGVARDASAAVVVLSEEGSPTAEELSARLAQVRAQGLSDSGRPPSFVSSLDELSRALELATTRRLREDIKTKLDALEATPKVVKDASPRAPQVGTLSLDTEPWTRVFLGRRSLGETPLVEQVVPAGSVRLRLVNESEGIDTLVDLKVSAGRLTTKQYKLK